MRPAVVSRSPGLAPGLAVAIAVTASLALAGCGRTAARPTGDQGCRSQWAQLAESIAGRTPDTGSHTEPSMLADRWNSVAAGLQYYATSATPADCGDTLDRQRLSIEALTDFGNGLRRFDMEYQRDQLTGPARAYLAGALPRHVKGKAVPKRAVRNALDTLTMDATTASQDMSPAWVQANGVDLADSGKVRRSVADLIYLGDHSAAYRACLAAADTIRRAIGQLISKSGDRD